MPNRYHDPRLYMMAMDAALEIEQARRDCQPYLGNIVYDPTKSPADLYELVFHGRGVDTTGVDESAYPAMLKLLRHNPDNAGAVAMDAASQASLQNDFPMVARVGNGW